MPLRSVSLSLAWLIVIAAPSRVWAQQPGLVAPVDEQKFSIVVIPDAQKYADMDTDLQYEQRWSDQTAWVRWVQDNRAAFNIAFVSVVGDIVQNFGQYSQEWSVARNAMNQLHENGHPHDPPITASGYSVAIGNHDYDHKLWTGNHPQNGTVTNIVYGTSNWRAQFGLQYYANHGYAWWGGSDQGFVYGSPIHGAPGPWTGEGLNRYQIISGGGYQFLHLGLELGIPDYAIAWAEQVLAQHPGMPTIVSTHALINGLGNFLDVYQMWREDVGNSGQEVWDKFLKRHPQIFMAFCGHNGIARNRTLQNDAGSDVHILLTDYVSKKLPGETGNGVGWLRIYTFDPVTETIRGQTFSPVLNEFASNSGSGPVETYPAAGTGDALNGNLSDFTISFDWDTRF